MTWRGGACPPAHVSRVWATTAMALRGFASLGSALMASAALHAGALVALDAVSGGPAGNKAEGKRRTPSLYATLSGTKSAIPRQSATDMAVPATNDSLAAAPLPGLVQFPLPNYLPVGDLDRKPEAIGEIPLEYPADMPLVKHSNVILSLLIDEQGKVDKVIVEASNTPPELAEVASRAFLGSRFRPGMRENQPVKSRLRIEVTFQGE